ncbi:MAG TPA: hypothetical protein PKE31_11805 [Pseudomonadota bacterium]|nr:hypothetical protein [Pseudomonadota bacterium]
MGAIKKPVSVGEHPLCNSAGLAGAFGGVALGGTVFCGTEGFAGVTAPVAAAEKEAATNTGTDNK